MRYFELCFLILLGASCLNAQPDRLLTPLEEVSYNELTKNIEVMEYVYKLDSMNDKIETEVIGYSVMGKPIPLISVGMEDLAAKEKLHVFFFAQQHGNEPSGMEGLLLLLSFIASGEHQDLFEHINLLVIPQVNPDGGDLFHRRNARDIDLNRDHLLLNAPESAIVQGVFQKYLPEVTVDFHEYFPYSKSWKEFGYVRDFDIQLGGITNINIDPQIYAMYREMAFPYVKDFVEKESYSFFEYTLGHFPSGERLRHSTVDINDGRQSLGICNTLSFIVEGKRGEDTLSNMKNRAWSQYYTALGILSMANEWAGEINRIVHHCREKLLDLPPDHKVSVRMDHFQSEIPLYYPLKSLNTGNDTVFIVENFHTDIKSLAEVIIPRGYLIPRSEPLLMKWLERSGFVFEDVYEISGDVMQYIADERIDVMLEGYPNKELTGLRMHKVQVKMEDYVYVPVRQLNGHKIVQALEPHAIYGLGYYPEFSYLSYDPYPVLRMEF